MYGLVFLREESLARAALATSHNQILVYTRRQALRRRCCARHRPPRRQGAAGDEELRLVPHRFAVGVYLRRRRRRINPILRRCIRSSRLSRLIRLRVHPPHQKKILLRLIPLPLAAMLAKELLCGHFTSGKESEGYSKLLDFMKRGDSVIEVDVPGCGPNQRHLKSTDLARLLTKAIIDWFICLHWAGWLLNGEISSDDIYLTCFGSPKLKEGKMKLLKRCKIKRRERDMNAVANVIQDGIFKSGNMPCDFQHLLWLLRHFRSYYVDLVPKHSSLLDESSNLFLIRRISQRLRQLSKLDPAKYSRIISKIPYCNMDQDHWKLRCQQNQYLMKILEPGSTLSAQAQPTHAPTGTQPPVALQISSIGPDYDNSAYGLMKLLWNCYWGIINYSVGEVEQKKVVLFKHPQVQHMLSVALPLMICKCQKAMHVENELSLCQPSEASLRDLM